MSDKGQSMEEAEEEREGTAPQATSSLHKRRSRAS